MSRILYKYLDIKGGKAMLGNKTLQYTNATQLNDPFDCHPGLLDYSNIPETYSPEKKQWYLGKLHNDAMNQRNRAWLCSLSKRNDSILMWAHYCQNHSGICIGLNMEEMRKHPIRGNISLCPCKIEVQYVDILKKENKKPYLEYLLGTKAKEWEYEQEVRLVIDNPSWCYAVRPPRKTNSDGPIDPKIVRFYNKLTPECFESIYFGIKTDENDVNEISEIVRKFNPNIKLYQMAVDENALLLKAEEITDK